MNCKKCNERLDIPKILPCGVSVCTYCVSTVKETNGKFECFMCSNSHHMPKDGFPSSEALMEMLQLEPSKIYRGDTAESLNKKINEIKDRIDLLANGWEYGVDKLI